MVGVIGRNERKRDRGEKRDEAREILKTTGLGQNEQKLAKNLTLIEKKRLEVARALATKPRVILLDEVLAGPQSCRRSSRPWS